MSSQCLLPLFFFLSINIQETLSILPKHVEYYDLSYSIHNSSAIWPQGSTQFKRKIVNRGYLPQGPWLERYHFCMDEHTGTHLDAPVHFAKGKWTIDQIPLTRLMAQGVLIDITEKVERDSNAELTTEDIELWLENHGSFPDGSIILIRTGWSSRYHNSEEYYGMKSGETHNFTFPGIHPDASQFLASYEAHEGSQIFGVGIEGPSLDSGRSSNFKAHETLFKSNMYGMENLKNMTSLPSKGFELWVMPMKLLEGSGGPVRVIAIINGSISQNPGVIPLTYIVIIVLLMIFLMFYNNYSNVKKIE